MNYESSVVSIFSEVGESALILKGPQGRIQRAVWWPLNRTIISAGEDAVIRIWDSEVTIGYDVIRYLHWKFGIFSFIV